MSSASPTAGEPDSLVQRLVEDMRGRWQRGDRPRADEYLARLPDLTADPGAPLELIYEEVCLRREHGEEVDPAEVFRRFPRWREALALLLDCHRILGPALTGPRFPGAGDTLGDFRLVAELGRGSAGRVFLATQATLADRPVVLKLVPRTGREHLALARLQHTHIVPLYAVQDDPARGLRVLCMPYFGGLTLAQLLQALRDVPPGERSADDVQSALQGSRLTAPVALPGTGPVAVELEGPRYTRAVCWVGACLAEALHHAHQRGLVHLDLKPSNVLLAADGTPMLLDFHLARAPVPAGGPPPEWLGGTPTYMAPEQEAALTALREGRPLPADVDARADVYGLGLVLYEALGGQVPPPARAPGRVLRRRNPRVPLGLADVLERCLARDPRQRYPGAALLAEDLQRHLADLPLRGVANRNPLERWRKFRRRQPAVPIVLALAAAVVLAVGAGLGYGVQQANQARDALRQGQNWMRQGQYGEARSTFKHGLALVQGLPFTGRLTDELGQELRRAQRAATAQDLHRFVEQLRPLYGAEDAPRPQLRDVLTHCKLLWDRRDDIVERLVVQPPPGTGDLVRTDMLELAIIWTDLRVRFPRRGQEAAARQDALFVLNEAESLFGPSCVLDRERQDYARGLKEAVPPGYAPPPRTPWEHYALGRALLRAGDLKAAEEQLEEAVRAQPAEVRPGGAPRDPWPYYYRGRCAYQEGNYEEAINDFSGCAAIAPYCAWCFHNRALVYTERNAPGDTERALRDYDCCLTLDPGLTPAALRRSRLRAQLKNFDGAEADLRLAQQHGARPAAVAYGWALLYQAKGEITNAVTQLHEALRLDPSHREAQALLDRLEAGR